jgi:hypothetical protein
MQLKWRELNVPSSVAGVPFPVDKFVVGSFISDTIITVSTPSPHIMPVDTSIVS